MFCWCFGNLLCWLLPWLCSAETALTQHINYTNCGPPSLLYVSVTPCASEPCQVKHGTNATVIIHFTAIEDAKDLKNNVFGIVAGVPVPFQLPNNDGCHNSNITCPAEKGNTYTYHNSFPVKKTYPDIKLPVMWEMRDEKDTQLLCFVFPLEIID